MRTTAHPDDEHGGMLAKIGHDEEARVSLLAARGGSRRQRDWFREAVRRSQPRHQGPEGCSCRSLLRDRPAVFPRQPWISASRSAWMKRSTSGSRARAARSRESHPCRSSARARLDFEDARDGHGNHQAAGLITQEAWKAAETIHDHLPEQIREGLRPWRPWKLYMGGVRGERRLDTAARYRRNAAPALGESYDTFARLGLGTSVLGTAAASIRRRDRRSPCKRLETQVPQRSAVKPLRLWETQASSTGSRGRPDRGTLAVGPRARAAERDCVAARRRSTRRGGVHGLHRADPAAAVPSLARGLERVREAVLALLKDEPEAIFQAASQEEQFMDAINAALGLDLSAVAQPASDDAALRRRHLRQRRRWSRSFRADVRCRSRPHESQRPVSSLVSVSTSARASVRIFPLRHDPAGDAHLQRQRPGNVLRHAAGRYAAVEAVFPALKASSRPSAYSTGRPLRPNRHASLHSAPHARSTRSRSAGSGRPQPQAAAHADTCAVEGHPGARHQHSGASGGHVPLATRADANRRGSSSATATAWKAR